MYRWLVFIHIASTLGFMLAHGVSASVAFTLQRERSLERVRAMLQLSADSYKLMYLSLLVLLLSGIVTGIVGNWWRTAWMWVSLLLLVAIVVAMATLGGPFYSQLRKAVGLPYLEKGKPKPALPERSPEEIDALLAKANPMLLTVIGYGGILLVLWLMIFKPF